MSTLQLRGYQQDAVNTLWNAMFTENHALCVMPTGSGKTEVMMAFLGKAIEKKTDLRAVVLLDKVTLVEQTARRFNAYFGAEVCGTFCGSVGVYDTHYPITIASIQSIFDVDLDLINLLIIDECHGVNEEDGRYRQFMEACRSKNEKLKVLGFTATPFRATGHIYGDGKLFPRITFQRSLRQMMDLSYLVTPRLKRVEEQFDVSNLSIRAGEFATEDVERLVGDEGKVREQIRDALPRMAGRRKVVWATSSIAHCEMVFRLLGDAGEDVCKVHSKMSDRERDEHLYERFERGEARHLVFVSIVSTGYDYPPIDCVVLMRPMRSPVLYVQTIGRGLRPAKGKEDCLVLDYGRVVETIGPLDSPRVPKPGERKGQRQEILMKFCSHCLEYQPVGNTRCCCCDADLVQERDRMKNLTRKASDAGELLKEPAKPVVTQLRATQLSRYLSKNGNICLCITYFPREILSEPIREFFVWSNQWAKQRGLSRLAQLGVCAWQGATLDELIQSPVRCPTQVTTLTQKKYPEIIKISYDREGTRDGDPESIEPIGDLRMETTF